MEEPDIKVKIKQSEKTIEATIKSSMTILQVKEKIGTQIDAKAADMKLIFKGKILKDADTVKQHGIENDNTMHLVISSKQPQNQSKPTTQTQSQQPTQQLPNQMNTGLGQMPFGLGGLGLEGINLNDQVNLQQQLNNMDIGQMLSNPQVQQMMSQIMSDPQQMQQILQLNPMLQQMANNNPMMKAAIQNPQLMQQMFNPQLMQQAAQMLQQGGLQNMGLFNFQQPNQNQQQQPQNNNTTNTTNTNQQQQPSDNQQQQQQQPQQQQQQQQQPNIFNMLNNPMFSQLLNQVQQPAQNNSQSDKNLTQEQLEQKYASQLEQLKGMGFTNQSLNIETLSQCNGNVEVAVERLLKLFGDKVN